MTITWAISTVVGDNGIDDDEKRRETAGDFDHHADAAVRCRAHCPMEHTHTSLEATGCRHWASACAILPQRPPWSTNTLKTHKTLTKNYF